jgi:hypothetical protein
MSALGDVAAALGLPVFACDGEKRPIVAGGFKSARTDREAIIAAFERPGAEMIGVPTGRLSGLVIIDVDIKGGQPGMDWLDSHATLLPETRTHKTRSGGLHLVFKYPDGFDIRNSASRIAPGVDVRAEGGYACWPGSPGYSIADHTRPAEMPGWLIQACLRPEFPEPEHVAPPPSKPRESGGSAYGLAALRDECDAIRRAGFGNQEHTLNSAALKIGALVAGGEIEEGVALSELLAAGRAMPSQPGRDRWSPTEVENKVRRGMQDGRAMPRQAPQTMGGEAARATTSQDARPPEPPAMSILDRSAGPPPALELAVFGPFWGDWITRTAEGANAPPDYVALPLLALASSLLGNARWVVAWHGWAEPPALWCASVGNPSSGKSSGASPVTRDVLAKIEAHVCRDYPQDIKQWETLASVAKAVLKQWEKDAAKAIKNKEAVPEKPAEATAPPKPIRPRARVVDVTVERLAAIIEGLPKGVLYVRDELAGWLMNLSRYANGGSDRPFWLESYNGGAMQVDRVKNPDPVFIPHLTVPVFGTIQPDRLADTLGGADDGLPSRFLWAWPTAQPFARPAGGGDPAVAADRLLRLADLRMGATGEGAPMPTYVHLANDAAEALAVFARDMQGLERDAHGLLKSSIGKARGQALRLAMVLEYLWWCGDGTDRPEPQRVSLRAMQAAAGLMEAHFLPMARRALGDASVPADERNARTLATWIVETRPERVNVSSIRDGARLPGLRESDPVKAACRYLVEARWLTEAPLGGGPGRPRGDYIVNPLVWEVPR